MLISEDFMCNSSYSCIAS